MRIKQKVKISTILLWSVLALSLVHFVVLMLALFGVITPEFLDRDDFNYIVAFIFVALCLACYIVFMFIEKSKKLVIPEWFKNIFFIAFFLFTNIYYFFGLYTNLWSLIIFYIYIAFILNILALSIFFNTQKSDNNVLRTTNTFTSLTTFTYAVSAGAMLEVVISAIKLMVNSSSMFATLSMAVIDMCVIILVSVIMAITYGMSLARKKVIINACLIKYYK